MFESHHQSCSYEYGALIESVNENVEHEHRLALIVGFKAEKKCMSTGDQIEVQSMSMSTNQRKSRSSMIINANSGSTRIVRGISQRRKHGAICTSNSSGGSHDHG